MISKGRRLRPSPAMVVAFVALFVALAGTAFSAGSKVPGKNGVKSSDIAPKAVKTSDLGTEAVTGEKVAANAVTGDKVSPDSLTGGDISYGSHVVTGTNIEGSPGALASCPAGEIATGGGAESRDFVDTGALMLSRPQQQSGPATAWLVGYDTFANAGEIVAYAICTPA
jgi:hypothetical protein